MHESRFDALARSLVFLRSRRTALGLVAALVIGGTGETVAKKKGKKRKKKRKHAAVSPPPPPPPLPPPCLGQPDDAPCDGSGKCHRGVCNQPPACLDYYRSISGSAFCYRHEDCC